MELSCVAGLIDPLPDTLANVTARDGLHIFFEGETEHKNKKYVSGSDDSGLSCIDIKAGDTQYVVGPGCTFEGKPYRIERNLPIAPLPQCVRDAADYDAPAPTDSIERTPPPPLDVAVRALKYLAQHDKEGTRDRAVWLETLAAMKFDYGEAGREAADDWSETAENFDAEVQKSTWASLQDAPVSARSGAQPRSYGVLNRKDGSDRDPQRRKISRTSSLRWLSRRANRTMES